MTNEKDNLFSRSTELYIIKVMLNRPDSIVEIAQKLKPEDFFFDPARYLFGSIKRLSVQGDVTPEGIMTFLETENKQGYDVVNANGGAAGMRQSLIDNSLPATPAVDSHIEVMKSFTYRRNAIDVADKIKHAAISNVDTEHNRQFAGVDEIDDKIKEMTYRLAQDLRSHTDIKQIGNKVQKVKKMLIEKEAMGISIHNLHPKLNAIIKGLRKGALYVFGAAEKVGKSSFMLDIAWYCAYNLGIPTGYGDTEMMEEEVILRLASKISGVPEDFIVNKYEELEPILLERVEKAFEIIEKAPFYHFNCNTMNNNELESSVKLLQLQKGVEIFFYDYVKIQTHEVEKGRTDLIMGAKIDTLKEKIAKSCDIPVITSGQMVNQNGYWKFAETAYFGRYADVIAVLARNEAAGKNEHHLGTHHVKLIDGRKVNAKDRGTWVDFMFEQDNHRIREIG